MEITVHKHRISLGNNLSNRFCVNSRNGEGGTSLGHQNENQDASQCFKTIVTLAQGMQKEKNPTSIDASLSTCSAKTHCR